MGENDLWSFPRNFKSFPNNLPEVEKVCGSRFWVVADLSYISPSYGAVGLVVAEILTTPTRCRPMEMWMVVNDDSFFFVTNYPVSWTYPTDESRFTSPWWLLRFFLLFLSFRRTRRFIQFTVSEYIISLIFTCPLLLLRGMIKICVKVSKSETS